MRRALIIPAAGAGSRPGADVPRFLATVGGRPMIDILLDLYKPFFADETQPTAP